MRISDLSSDVCSSDLGQDDLAEGLGQRGAPVLGVLLAPAAVALALLHVGIAALVEQRPGAPGRLQGAEQLGDVAVGVHAREDTARSQERRGGKQRGSTRIHKRETEQQKQKTNK